jgi:integrase
MTTTGELSFTRGEVEKILKACSSLEDEVLVRLAASTGLRRIDISKIRIENITLNKVADYTVGRLTYTEHKKWIGGNKGEEGAHQKIRTIPIHWTVAQKIGQLVDSLGKDGIKKNQGYLFSWGRSKYGDKTAWYHLQDLANRAGIPPHGYSMKDGKKVPHWKFHAFRATAIKLMQAAGYEEAEVAAITGDTINVIHQHYMTPTDAELSETVKQKELI